MKIRRLLLRDFGCLRGEFHFAADRVNLVLEPNEKGKTTLAAAILAGLYGFPAGQRRSESRPVPDADIHRPWHGGDYLVEIDVEADGRVYTVRRNFARREERVYEWRTGKEITEEFQASKDVLDFGGRIAGIDREDFARTVFIRQGEVSEVRDTPGLTSALQRMATSQQGDVAAAEAIEILRNALRQYKGRKIRRGRIESEIAEIDDEIQALSERLHAMEERRRQAEERILDLERTTEEEGRVDAALQRLEYLVIASGRREDAIRLEEEERERLDLAEREAEFQTLARYAEFPADGLPKILELRGRLQGLVEEARRALDRGVSEIDEPLRGLETEVAAEKRFGSLSAADLSRFSEAEADLAAAWKARRESRRALRLERRRHVDLGVDTDRLRSLSAKYGALTTEEKRFLLTCGEQEMTARTAAAEMERDAERLSAALGEADSRAQRSRTRSLGFAVGAVLLAAGGLGLYFSAKPHLWSYGLFGLAAAAYAIHLATRPGASLPSRIGALRAERDGLSFSLASKQEEAKTIRSRLEALASRQGIEGGEAFLEEFREAESRQDLIAEQASLLRRLEEAESALLRASARVEEITNAASYEPRFGAITPRTARRFRTVAAAYRAKLTRIEDLRERRRALDDRIAGLTSEQAALRREANALLATAGLPPTDDANEAARTFEEAQQKRERYETLKREVIPSLVRRSMTHQGEPLRRAVEVADAVLRRRIMENPSLGGLTPEKSHKEYAEDRDKLRQTSRSLVERRVQLSADLGEVLKEYRKEYPDTQRWQREWCDLRERASAFKSSVEMACETLETLSREAYAEWADVLNERASETLKILVPGYDDIRFDEDLTFTLRDAREGTRRAQEDVVHRFSAGTRDPIYLAARLAMGGYLSSGRIHLPLVLDDPFANFDDERFSRAMEFLLDKVGRRHQVILFSCHEARHRSWQERNGERFSERARVMSLQMPAV